MQGHEVNPLQLQNEQMKLALIEKDRELRHVQGSFEHHTRVREMITMKNEEIANLEAKVQKSDGLLTTMRAQMTKKDKEITALKAQIHEQELDIHLLGQRAGAMTDKGKRDKEIKKLNAEIEKLEGTVADLDKKNATLAAEKKLLKKDNEIAREKECKATDNLSKKKIEHDAKVNELTDIVRNLNEKLGEKYGMAAFPIFQAKKDKPDANHKRKLEQLMEVRKPFTQTMVVFSDLWKAGEQEAPPQQRRAHARERHDQGGEPQPPQRVRGVHRPRGAGGRRGPDRAVARGRRPERRRPQHGRVHLG